ncbi:MAG TPA: calcium-binding protein, partial [bacterium]|nr:calcium-binding protein [bacterium]
MQPKAFAVLACLLAAVPVSLAAAPGDLDAGFGANGLVIVNINNQQSFPAGLAIQDDGKIVIGGTNGPVGARDFMVIRGLPDATPDPAFGNNGVAVTPVGPGEDVARDIAVLPDGKILAVGSTDLNGGFDVAFVRYHPDGSLDGTFGTGGIVIAP